MSELEDLKRLVLMAEDRGDKDTAFSALQRMDQISKTVSKGNVGLKDADIQAIKQVKVDPLAGFRDKPYEEQLKLDEFDWDPYKGVAFIGRGTENLIQGGKQIGGDLGEKIGILSQVENEEFQEKIHGRMASAEQPYGILREGNEGAADFGEIIGETAPFVSLPVPEIAAGFAGLARVINPIARFGPEAVVAGSEAAIPYAESGEARTGRMQEGAAGGALAKLGIDYMAKRANARRMRMATDELQEFQTLGDEFDIPVRQGNLDEQLDRAQDAAVSRTTGSEPSVLAQQVTDDLEAVVTKQNIGMDEAYEGLLDQVAGSPSVALARDSGGRMMPQGSLDLRNIRSNVNQKIKAELELGSMADDKLLTELERWADMPERVTVEGLQEFRSRLRRRTPTGDAGDAFRKLDKTIGDEVVAAAEKAVPGSGDAMRRMDDWFNTEIPRIMDIPAIKGTLKDNASPQAVMNLVMGKRNKVTQEVANMMTDSGKKAVSEAYWNQAFTKATQGKNFNPLMYGKFIDDSLDSAKQFMTPQDIDAFDNLGKLMRHISGKGQNPDSSMLKLIRGFPFMYRAIADQVRQSNFKYLLSNAAPGIRPGSPAMERFYRSVIRGIAIQEDDAVQDPMMDMSTGMLNEATGLKDEFLGRLSSRL